MYTENKTKKLVTAGVMTAIIILMANVPYLGYIPLGFMNATIIHVPVIIGAVLLGPKYGGFLGFVFGLTSLVKNTMAPNATSFVFSPFISIGEFGGSIWSLVICLVPRILIGVVSWYVFAGVKKLLKNRAGSEITALGIAGVAGSLTNTLLVMNFIYLFFGNSYAAATGRAFDILYSAILGIILGSGIPEAIVASVLTIGITKVMFKAGFRIHGSTLLNARV